MADNVFAKAEKLAAVTLGLLEHQAVLASLVTPDSGADFTGAANDTVNIKRPSRLNGSEEALTRSSSREIESENLSEWTIPVKLSSHIYSAVDLSDAELTLDIADFGEQVLVPQTQTIVRRVERKVAAALAAAPSVGVVEVDKATGDEMSVGSVRRMVTKARNRLNQQDVPVSGRVLVVGADVESALLNDPLLVRVDTSGTDSVLRESTIGRLAGFTIVTSNYIDPGTAVAFHPSAYILVNRAPVVPTSAQGASKTYEGLSVRVMRDYNSRTASDRSFLSTYTGIGEVLDAPEGTPKGQEDKAAKQLRAVSFKLKPVDPPKPESK
ncbi:MULTISPECIES: P22 phage major capsid protein family protein [Streptomyces]|uniref:P22 phage major capsid protein family protein n=1 Tax=Streptomyces TaxID=1883 RepID=UPI000B9E3DB1|nr:P22 phage major capsid protein family protein [Streptomyces kasugaensis]